MAKKKDNKLVEILIIAGITMIIIVLWWTFKGTIATLVILLLVWALFVTLTYVFINLRNKRLAEAEESAEKVQFLSQKDAEEIMLKTIEDKGLLVTRTYGIKPMNIQPEDSEQKPTEFFYMVFEDLISNLYFLIFINRENADIGFDKSEGLYDKDTIKDFIRDGAKSTRAFVPRIRTFSDGSQETTYDIPRRPKIKTIKEEEVIEDD